jgi:hypothetical protein
MFFKETQFDYVMKYMSRVVVALVVSGATSLKLYVLLTGLLFWWSERKKK